MSARRVSSVASVILLLGLLSVCKAQCQATAVPGGHPTAQMITEPIHGTAPVVILGTVHPLANAANDRGAAPDGLQLKRIHLVFKRSESQERALKQLVNDLHTTGSVRYHKWLTAEEFGRRFGPPDDDIKVVMAWLQSKGFAVSGPNPGKQTIEFSGNAGQFRTAFHASIHSYEVRGRTHYANASNPDIPAALARVVGGFVALNDFPIRSFIRTLGKASYQSQTHRATPLWTYPGSTSSLLMAPADFAVQYDLNPLYQSATTGSGQSIAIINEANINIEQVNQFRSIFGFPANPPQIVIDGDDPGIDGINNTAPNYASAEAYLDVEWAGAVAPDATVYLVIAADSYLEPGLLLAAEHAVYSNIAPVLSISFGECEQNLGSTNSFISSLWEQAAAQGMTVIVPTGDSGADGCDDNNTQEYAVSGVAVNGFASTPYNVAVGGTDFYYSDYENLTTANLQSYWNLAPTQLPQVSLLKVIPEQPWNDSQYGLDVEAAAKGTSSISAAGGGASSCQEGTSSPPAVSWTSCTAGYPKPAWQIDSGVPSDSERDIPDLALFAGDGGNLSYYPICASDGDCQPVSGGAAIQITEVGGTSATAPAFAGIMALVNQRFGRQGQADFALYPLKAQFPAAFRDVLQGNNSVPCSYSPTSPNCIGVSNPATVDDPILGSAVEGQSGSGTTPAYNASAGYNLATGLGTVDSNELVNHWGDVSFSQTTTILGPSTNAFVHGTPITISGKVTALTGGVLTGDVALMTDSPTPLQQGLSLFNLSNGEFFSNGLIDLPGGTYNIWGRYSGDRENSPSTSATTQVTVTPEESGIAFWASTADYGSLGWNNVYVPYGTLVTLEAQIETSGCPLGGACPSATRPSGAVAFLDNRAVIGTAGLNGADAAQYVTAFPIGPHSVEASYSGDASYSPSSAPAAGFTVVEDTPTISVSVNGTGSGQGVAGQPTVLTIQVVSSISGTGNSDSPGGEVIMTGIFPSGITSKVWLVPAVVPGTSAAEGVVNIVFPANTPLGSYPVSLTYQGDSNYRGGSDVTAWVNVIVAAPGGGIASSVKVATSEGSSTPFSAIQLTGSVTGQLGDPAPTGTLSFYSSGFELGGYVLASPATGSTTLFSFMLSSQMLFQGADLIVVQYSGDSNYQASLTTLSLSNPLSDFSMIPGSTNILVSPGSSAAENIQVSSINGFTGAVSYTCSAVGGLDCSMTPSSTSLSSNGSAVTALTVTAPAATGNGTYGVLISGTSANGQFIHTLGLEAIVSGSGNPNQSIALTNSGTVSVAPAASQQSTLTVTPSGGFTGTVNLSCFVINSPIGLTCSALPVKLVGTAPAISAMIVDATSGTPMGNYIASFTAADAATGKISSSTSVPIDVVALAMITPTVIVALSASSITAAQPLVVAVTVVGGIGSLSPTGTVALTGGGYASAASALTNGTATFIVPAGSFTSGSDTLTVTYTPDSSSSLSYYGASAATVVLVSPLLRTIPTVMVTPSASTVTTQQALAVKVVVNGATGGSTPGGTVTCSGGGYDCPSTPLTSGAAIFNIPAGSLATGADWLTVAYSGDTNYFAANDTASVTVETAVPPSFTISGKAITLAQGATSANTSTITLDPVSGFTGSIGLTASITSSPAGAQYPPALSFGSTSPVSLSGSTPAEAILTISTTASTSNALAAPRSPSAVPGRALGGAALACVLLIGFPRRRRTRRRITSVLVLLAFLVIGLASCGTSITQVINPGDPGTTPGTYTITVTGISGSTSETDNLILTVQ